MLAAGIEADSLRQRKLTKTSGKERPNGSYFAGFVFVVFCWRNYERKARSRPY